MAITETPCREFLSLDAWLRKYALRTIGPEEVYATDANGVRKYIGHDQDMCKAVKDWLRDHRMNHDVVYVRTLVRNYGSKGSRANLNVRVATPTGRLKAEETFKMY